MLTDSLSSTNIIQKDVLNVIISTWLFGLKAGYVKVQAM